MGLSTEAILAIVGLFIALPPTVIALWRCKYRSVRSRSESSML